MSQTSQDKTTSPEQDPSQEKWWLSNPTKNTKKRWTTLSHNGVIFAPPYEPHGVKMLYDGKPVDLTPRQEEVATYFVQVMERDSAKKPIFQKNFFKEFKKVLGEKHIIKEFSKCDFTPIYQWYQDKLEKKKQMSKEEKKALSEQKKKDEEPYAYCMVDGRREKVGNFKVEPPGLFQGRGQHPRQGVLKKRIMPEDVVINIGEGEPVPAPPAGHHWKAVVHDHTVTWLAAWKDGLTGHLKYVFLTAASRFRNEADMRKFQKARLLCLHIDDIRKDYWAKIAGSNIRNKQLGVATYLIDRFAIRVGNEKGEDTADTVGCCTLKVGNVMLEGPSPPNTATATYSPSNAPPYRLHFDFLGKDSIRYDREVDVAKEVYDALAQFCRKRGGERKKAHELLFDHINAQILNQYLSHFLPHLSAKNFRTYNACITLSRLLAQTPAKLKDDVAGLLLYYNRANFEVARLCNHQRALPKNFQNTTFLLEARLGVTEKEREYVAALLVENGVKSDMVASIAANALKELKEQAEKRKEAAAKKAAEKKAAAEAKKKGEVVDDDDDSLSDDKPVKRSAKASAKKAAKKKRDDDDDSDDSDSSEPKKRAPKAKKTAAKSAIPTSSSSSSSSSSAVKDEEDELVNLDVEEKEGAEDEREFVDILASTYKPGTAPEEEPAVRGLPAARPLPNTQEQAKQREKDVLSAVQAFIKAEQEGTRTELEKVKEELELLIAVKEEETDIVSSSPVKAEQTLGDGESIVDQNRRRKENLETAKRLESKQNTLAKLEEASKKWKEQYAKKSVEQLKRAFTTLTERVRKLRSQLATRKEGAQFALSTSRMNYLDPRVTTVWCQKWGVPIERVFAKTLREKFPWAFDVDPNWRFEDVTADDEAQLQGEDSDSDSDDDAPKKGKGSKKESTSTKRSKTPSTPKRAAKKPASDKSKAKTKAKAKAKARAQSTGKKRIRSDDSSDEDSMEDFIAESDSESEDPESDYESSESDDAPQPPVHQTAPPPPSPKKAVVKISVPKSKPKAPARSKGEVDDESSSDSPEDFSSSSPSSDSDSDSSYDS